MSELSGSLVTPSPGSVPDAPYLARWEASGALRCWPLAGPIMTVGRAAYADVVLADDPRVSRVHLTLERIGAVWVAADNGLSRNGTFVNGRRVVGRVPLQDRDQLLVGGTRLTYCSPGGCAEPGTLAGEPLAATARITPAQRAVLTALCRPCADGSGTPATNQAIAEELVLSVDAVKTHLRALCHGLGIEGLPQNRKRARLAEIALRCGLVAPPVR